jgi:hypothetical protein
MGMRDLIPKYFARAESLKMPAAIKPLGESFTFCAHMGRRSWVGIYANGQSFCSPRMAHAYTRWLAVIGRFRLLSTTANACECNFSENLE